MSLDKQNSEIKKSFVFPTLGFLISIILTLIAYGADSIGTTSKTAIIAIITICAGLQLLAQLYFFIHLGEDGARKQNISLGIFAVVILFTICGGSLWVLTHLRNNMMPGESMDKMYLNNKVAPETDIRP